MPFRITPAVLNIIIVNGLLFLFIQLNLDTFADYTTGWDEYILLYKSDLIFDVPDYVAKFQPIQLVSAMFSHVDMGHLLMNMFGLLFIGTIVEMAMSRRDFILMYLFSGVFGAVLTTLFDPTPNPVLGASGAIFGVDAALAYYFPNVKLSLLFLPFQFTAKRFVQVTVAISAAILIWNLVVQFGIGITATSDMRIAPGISHFGHLAGFAGGWLFLRRNKILGIFNSNKTNK